MINATLNDEHKDCHIRSHDEEHRKRRIMKNIASPSPIDSSHALDQLFGAMPDAKARKSLRRVRTVKDISAKYFVSFSGLGVIAVLTLIFVFLFAELMPLFSPAKINTKTRYVVPGDTDQQALLLAMDRHQEVGVRYDGTGKVTFFDLASGNPSEVAFMPLPDGIHITSHTHSEPRFNLVALGLSDGTAMLVRHDFVLDWTDNVRSILPRLDYPFGVEPVVVDERRHPLNFLAVQQGARGAALAAVTEDKRLLLTLLSTRRSFITGETVVKTSQYDLGPVPIKVADILVASDWNSLFLVDQAGKLHYYDIRDPARARLAHTLKVVPHDDVSITAVDLLLGTASIIVGRSDGSLSQYFLVRDEKNEYFITHIRDFERHPAAITMLAMEYSRKGFAAADASGVVGLHHATSSRTLLLEKVADQPIHALAFSPTAAALLVEDETRQIHLLEVFNLHPEVSFGVLWQKVWYEGRTEPDYVWQSTSATVAYEPKFSLMPLTWGTLKAAFYAMLMAMPLAILGAVYAAYFMSPKLRAIVKPSIEIMEALPTVILGFLAGLWLAPFTENNLPAVFSILLLMPLLMILTALAWSMLPQGVRLLVPDGWEAALLIPMLLLLGWICITLSPYVEIWFFDGCARQWLTNIGISYDQRNALVIGLAMGFAVIPNIFSIAEDAVFGVPKHLTQGSLALGATTWQTVTRVVLPTASPGIFSAVLIGFGRAVGETMIVLMASGNSPLMSLTIFEGMRTISANLAVESKEAAVASTHARILFLSAFVLLVLTFILNTAAELVRQRLRKKYSSL